MTNKRGSGDGWGKSLHIQNIFLKNTYKIHGDKNLWDFPFQLCGVNARFRGREKCKVNKKAKEKKKFVET